MKRPPQLWVVITVSIGVLCLLPNALGLRATSLIFGKTSTTTSSTTEGSTSEETTVSASESPADNQTVVTKPPLTGIPQIDYIYDPNLPSELNGFNLSDYPFYSRVPDPEELNFKCDGLHDGFYASVEHKCQVYHHCLFGTRFDFLCANFTAFDQRTFICHFASEVDCANSKNFWHRNDALYEATTTVAPIIVATPSPALNPNLRRPSPLAGLGRPRRPLRRRPAFDYYYDEEEDYREDDRDRIRPRGRGDKDSVADRDSDEYYDDPPPRNSGRRRNKRPRPNRRPIDYDEYDEYEEDRYERRPGRRNEDRRPYRDDDRYDDRRPSSKPKNRPADDEDEIPTNDRRKTDDRRPANKPKNRPADDEDEIPTNDRRKTDDRRPSNKPKNRPADDEDEISTNDRRKTDDRRPSSSIKNKNRPEDEDDVAVNDRRKTDDRRRPSDDRRGDDYDRRPYDRDRRKPLRDRYEDDKEDDRRSYDRPRKTDEDKNDRRSYDRPRKQDDDDRRYRPKETKAPVEDKDDRRSYDRPRKPAVDDDRRYRPREKEERARPTEETKVMIKPSGSSVYARPRAPPIIRRPVPKTDREKFDYKLTTASSKPSAKPAPEDEEYYEDYEEELKPKPTPRKSLIDANADERRGYASKKRPQGRRPIEDEEEKSTTTTTKRSQEIRQQQQGRGSGRYESSERTTKKPIVEEDYADEYEEDKSIMKGESSRERGSSEKTNLRESIKTQSSTEENVSREREQRPVIKVVKRPFLPSRGGNPFVARGLQPVGAKALDASPETIIKPAEPTTEKLQLQEETEKGTEEEYYDDEEEIKPVTTKRPSFRSQTTPKPKEILRNPLDINENEYDVTLNDALNPTLPNLPIRSVPTGFSSGRDGYLSQSFPRPRLIAVESPILTAANSDYVYVKQPTRYNPYVAVQHNRQPYTTYQ